MYDLLAVAGQRAIEVDIRVPGLIADLPEQSGQVARMLLDEHMSAYKHALVVDDASSEQRLALAAAVLDRCEGVVMLDGVVALRPTPSAILCEVIDPTPTAHRCAEEFKVLVENAGRGLAKSKLGRRLPPRPLRWLVVEDCGTGTVELWPAL